MANPAASTNPRSVITGSQLTASTTLKYPLDMDTNSPNFFEIRFVNYSRGVNLQTAQSQSGVTIFLPVPEQLSDTTNLNYSEIALGVGGIENEINSDNWAQAIANVGNKRGGEAFMLDKLRTAGPEVTAAAGAIVGGILGGAPGAVVGGIIGANAPAATISVIAGQKLGFVRNPDLSVEFKGVERKKYQFSWKMAAKSWNETNAINNIIDCIRWNTLPERNGGGGIGWTLDYPNIAFLRFHGNLAYGTAENPRQIIQFGSKGVVVTGVNILYNGSTNGQAFFAGSGEPVEVQLSLQMEDRDILTREQINTGWGNQ